ncbi:MAG: leucyl aminopeptidase [Dehalococcoidia bacterium]
MEVRAAAGNLAEQQVETLVVEVAEGAARLSGPAAQVDATLDGAITAMLRDGLITGRAGEVTSVASLGRVPAKRVVVHGTGKPEARTVDGVRTRAGNLGRALRGLDAKSVAIGLQQTDDLDAEAAGRALAEGVLLGLYRFDRHHTRSEDRPRGSVDSITLVEGGARRLAAVERGVEAGVILAEATNLTRDLANEPANLMTPTIVAERAQAVAAETGLECTIVERAEAERLGMGSYLSVANGSVQPPKFIVLRYRNGGRARPIGLIGKGITFDTGGISIKPAAGMERMKGDMTGAAAVIGAMQAIARLGPEVNVLAIAPCTENMPSGSATKPGDVVYAMDGQSIEVLNTDAEGRLVLADGLAYARRERCSVLVDVATLTGAMNIALGNVRIGTFANNDRLFADLERAAATAGERLWRMPLDAEYFDLIKSDVADIKNTGGPSAGSITAAKFLERFAHDTPWAHLDIAAVSDSTAEKGILVKGSTGSPVRTLVHFVLGRAR